MKKQLLTLATVLIAGFANAQTWSEDFSSATAPGLPAGWLQNNVDGHTVTTSLASYSFTTKAWVTKNISTSTSIPDAAAHGKIAASTSWYSPAGVSNDWLITPSFTVPTNGVLQWDALAPDASFPDGYSVKISTTGTLTTDFSTNLLTVPAENSTWKQRSINLNTYAGQTVRIAFINNSNDMDLLFVDNVSVIVPPADDIKASVVGPTGSAVWGMVGTTKPITGTMKNNGLSTVTSYTAKYSDGTTTASSVFSGLSLTYGQTHNFTISPSFSITAPQETKIKVWVEYTGDADQTNDTLSTTVNGYSFLPNHKVVFEEGTGTWCGWCPRGAVFMDSMSVVHPNTTVLIAVHNSDPMTVAAYDSGIGTLISGYPTVLCGRANDIGDPSDMFTMYSAHLADFAVGDLTLTPTFDPATRLATIAVDTKIASSFTNNTSTNDYRVAVVFTEDDVVGTASGYNQTNYYSSSSQNQPLVGAGRNWQTSANPVPAAQMNYDFVARAIVGGFSGLANSLPNNVVASATTSKTFTYTVPAAYNTNKMKAHALLIDAKTNIVYNANSTSYLTTSGVGIEEKSLDPISFGLFPNPANNNVTIDLNLDSPETITINVFNALGALVYTEVQSNLGAGRNSIVLNTESFTSGIYNVSISTKEGFSTKKLTITK